MPRLDEAISILKGTIELHQKQVEGYQREIDKAKADIARHEYTITSYRKRMSELVEAMEHLNALPR